MTAAFSMVKKVDPDGKRTLEVITNCNSTFNDPFHEYEKGNVKKVIVE